MKKESGSRQLLAVVQNFQVTVCISVIILVFLSCSQDGCQASCHLHGRQDKVRERVVPAMSVLLIGMVSPPHTHTHYLQQANMSLYQKSCSSVVLVKEGDCRREVMYSSISTESVSTSKTCARSLAGTATKPHIRMDCNLVIAENYHFLLVLLKNSESLTISEKFEVSCFFI